MDYNRDPYADISLDREPEQPKSLLGEVWTLYRSKFFLGLGALVGLYVLLESVHQVRIQRALAHAEKHEYSEALDSLKGSKLGFFRNDLARSIRDTARYHIAVETLDDAVRTLNFFVAQQNLAIAVATGGGVPSFEEDVIDGLEAWHEGLDSIYAQGELVKCRNGLDSLLRVETPAGDVEDKVNEISFAVTTKLFQGFAEREAWTEARKELQSLSDHPLEEDGLEDELRSELHARMTASMDAAVKARAFQRAEAIQKMIASYFPEQSIGPGLLPEIQFEKALTAGRKFEREGQFDRAMSSYESAMRMRPGSLLAFHQISKLRDILRFYVKESGSWHKADPATVGNEIVEADTICQESSYRRRLYKRGYSKKPPVPASIRDARLYSRGGFQGKWSLDFEESAATWVLAGRLEAPRKYYRTQAYGGIKIAVVITDEEGKTLWGKIDRIPLLLPGSAHDFEFRFPKRDGEAYVKIGVSR